MQGGDLREVKVVDQLVYLVIWHDVTGLARDDVAVHLALRLNVVSLLT